MGKPENDQGRGLGPPGVTCHPAALGTGRRRRIGGVTVWVVLAVASVACTGGGDDSGWQAQARSLEASVEDLAAENADLKDEVAILRQAQSDLVETQESADAAAGSDNESQNSAAEQAGRLASLEDGQRRTGERLDQMEARLKDVEDNASESKSAPSDKAQWPESKDADSAPAEGDTVERTARLAEEAGGEVAYVHHPGRDDRSVLVLPTVFVDGETPLIVSLHGYGGDSAHQSTYVPLHERVNTDGFAVLLPNASRDSQGNRAWNPTDRCCDGGKAGHDDVAYLTELVAEAAGTRNFGPVYFFGYSNGGFMAYHMACKGLPGLRAVASLAGTSYVEDSSCAGAAPVSVLHVHGSADEVILFEGDETGPDLKADGERAFYAGAEDMVVRWSRRAGCDWTAHARAYASLDLDQSVPGSETRAFRLEPECEGGVNIELWIGIDGGHAPSHGEAFTNALLDWLLAQT